MNRFAAVFATMAATVISVRAQDAPALPPAAERQGVTFAKEIQPIFERSCVKCHGPEKAKAKLRLDSAEAVLKGSEEGKVVEAGNSAKSKLILSVGHRLDKDLWMPPANNKLGIKPLTSEEIGLIRAWIDQGAK